MLKKSEIAELYSLHKKELIIYIFKMTGSQNSAEDILQDCFVNLIRYSEKYEIREKRAFLYKTAHNLTVNYLKKSNKTKITEIEDINLFHNDNTAEKLESDELNSEIYRLLNELPAMEKSIFIMRKELEMNMTDIAESTGKSERTIRRKLNSITNFLMQNLKKQGFIE